MTQESEAWPGRAWCKARLEAQPVVLEEDSGNLVLLPTRGGLGQVSHILQFPRICKLMGLDQNLAPQLGVFSSSSLSGESYELFTFLEYPFYLKVERDNFLLFFLFHEI